MSVSKRPVIASVISSSILLAGCFSFNPALLVAETPGASESAAQTPTDASRPAPVCEPSTLDSPYIPVDSWVYPAVLRLYGLGYIDTVFIGMRPWTRAALEHIVEQAGARIDDAQDSQDPALGQAQEIYAALDQELHPDMEGPCRGFKGKARVESAYTTARAITGTPLNDSFHLGQTVINDYGRPYESGFNNYTGASGYASAGRFTLYARGELQFAPSAAGYSTLLTQTLSNLDGVPLIDPATGLPYYQPTIPTGPIGSIARGRIPLRHTSRQTSLITKFPLVSRTLGLDLDSAVLSPTPTTLKISIRFASIASSPCISRAFLISSARLPTISSLALSKATRFLRTHGSTSKKSPSAQPKIWN